MNTTRGAASGKTVCLVACTSRKGLYPAPAEFIYRSPLFSAAHGLLAPTDEIAPYDQSIVGLGDAERSRWARDVYKVLRQRIEPGTRIVFLAGADYRMHLESMLRADGHETAAPMSSLGIGSQVSWLQHVASSKTRLAHLDRFYRLTQRIAATQSALMPLRSHSSKSVRAKRGVYLFFEPSEQRMTAPFEDRVIRVGTHSVSVGSRATLWNRLRTHRGGTSGDGNHRGSIFRLHVGDALIRRAGLEQVFPTWGVGQSASKSVRLRELEIEEEVSHVIGQMRVLWLEVDDEPSADSDRAYVERNVIAMLSGPLGPIDLPSGGWLGRWSSRDLVRSSGLWNVNHVREEYDARVLDILETYIEFSEGKGKITCRSIAPKGWRNSLPRGHRAATQIELVSEETSNE
jgi:hypothetical protein